MNARNLRRIARLLAQTGQTLSELLSLFYVIREFTSKSRPKRKPRIWD